MPDSQRYPWNLNLIKIWKTLSFEKCIFLNHFLKARNSQVSIAEKPKMKTNSFKRNKNLIFNSLLINKAFKIIPLKIGHWHLRRVPWNYAYSPFNDKMIYYKRHSCMRYLLYIIFHFFPHRYSMQVVINNLGFIKEKDLNICIYLYILFLFKNMYSFPVINYFD